MVSVIYGGEKGKRFDLIDSDEFIVIRTHRRRPLRSTTLTKSARRMAGRFETAVRFPAAGVEILRRRRDADLGEARQILQGEEAVDFTGRILCDPVSGTPVVYTENLFLKFRDDCKPEIVDNVLSKSPLHLRVKRRLPYARNAYFLGGRKGCGQGIFEIAEELLHLPEVELCHPEIVRERVSKRVFPQQWHLAPTDIDGQTVDAHASVETAWGTAKGEGMVIAIIDDGVDIEHEEFSTTDKIVSGRDVTFDVFDPRPKFTSDDHGTACAGVACADGLHGAAGVAPNARLMPIRLVSGLGSMDEADAFYWAAKFGADIISCSWGPPDGDWWNDQDPLHQQFFPLPDSTRLAIDAAVDHGRLGRGCVITWAAGNGNEPVENDGYASYEKVIAVAACNDRSVRSAYSDFGDALWCAFPSNDSVPALTPGIWTTDRSGPPGYNVGHPVFGDASGDYTNSFGGTSSACPGAAGIAALVLQVNRELRWDEVKNVLKKCCDKIDETNGNYNSEEHSQLYGYGRLNAERAVQLA